jgi:hypothetical protein
VEELSNVKLCKCIGTEIAARCAVCGGFVRGVLCLGWVNVDGQRHLMVAIATLEGAHAIRSVPADLLPETIELEIT